MQARFADELDDTNIGDDVTLTVGQVATGGTLEKVGRVLGMVALKIGGTDFIVDGGKPVDVRSRNLRQQILTEPDRIARGTLIGEFVNERAVG